MVTVDSVDVNTDVTGEATKYDAPPEDTAKIHEDDPDEAVFRIGKEVVLGELEKNSPEQIENQRIFWRDLLRQQNVRYICAPMVDQSELAFRMFTRKYNAHLTVTPMIHAHLFVNDTTYRRNSLALCKKDRPLVVQFCANNPDTFLSACRLVEGYCDAVDLNLGCPQMVAKRGHYGSYLQDEVDLICKMVSGVRDYCKLPISCKIRIRECREQTKEYARRLMEAGASMLTVHGRTREMKGADTGLADWSRIREVVESVDVPVVANGNIQMPGDVERCMAATGAVAVMSAEGLLYNPLIFHGEHRENWKVAREYLDFAKQFEAGVSAIRAHVFRICHHSMLEYADLRQKLGVVFQMSDFEEIVEELRKRTEELLKDDTNRVRMEEARKLFEEIRIGDRAMVPIEVARTPHWMVKPYFRLAELAKEREKEGEDGERSYKEQRKEHLKEMAEQHGLSLKQVRKRERRQISFQRTMSKKAKYTPCVRCGQPSGQGCAGIYCRRCCRWVCKGEKKDCRTHRYAFSHLEGETTEDCQTEDVGDMEEEETVNE